MTGVAHGLVEHFGALGVLARKHLLPLASSRALGAFLGLDGDLGGADLLAGVDEV